MMVNAKTVILTFAAASLLAGNGLAQDTIGIYADFGEGLAPSVITKPGTPFDVVVVTETGETSAAVEFVMTELMHMYAGVFKTNTTRIFDTPLDLGNNQAGEYIIAYGECAEPGTNEIVRVRYYDVDGEIGENVVLALRGFQPGDSQPSTFDGQMGYVTCGDIYAGGGFEGRLLEGAEWDSASNLDPMRIPGVESTDGIMVLNPKGLSVPVEGTSVGMLKSRF